MLLRCRQQEAFFEAARKAEIDLQSGLGLGLALGLELGLGSKLGLQGLQLLQDLGKEHGSPWGVFIAALRTPVRA